MITIHLTPYPIQNTIELPTNMVSCSANYLLVPNHRPRRTFSPSLYPNCHQTTLVQNFRLSARSTAPSFLGHPSYRPTKRAVTLQVAQSARKLGYWSLGSVCPTYPVYESAASVTGSSHGAEPRPRVAPFKVRSGRTWWGGPGVWAGGGGGRSIRRGPLRWPPEQARPRRVGHGSGLMTRGANRHWVIGHGPDCRTGAADRTVESRDRAGGPTDRTGEPAGRTVGPKDHKINR